MEIFNNNSALFDGLKDYLLFTLIISMLSPKIMMTCGVFATILAIFVYYKYYYDQENGRIKSVENLR